MTDAPCDFIFIIYIKRHSKQNAAKSSFFFLVMKQPRQIILFMMQRRQIGVRTAVLYGKIKWSQSQSSKRYAGELDTVQWKYKLLKSVFSKLFNISMPLSSPRFCQCNTFPSDVTISYLASGRITL